MRMKSTAPTIAKLKTTLISSPRLRYAVAAAALALSQACPAAVTPVAQSGKNGPTVLILTDPTKNDLTPEIAVHQAACWPLTRGSIVTAALDDANDAVAATHPDAIVMLRVSREADGSATLDATGLDTAKLVDTFNHVTDESEPGTEKLIAAAAATQPSIQPAIQPATQPSVAAEKTITVQLFNRKNGTVPAGRARLFRQAIYEMLKAEHMTDADPWQLIQPKKPGQINVALFAGAGSNSTPGTMAYPKAFGLDETVHYTYVGSTELRHPHLMDQFDVIVFCGGSGSAQGKAIGKEGLDKVREFVQNGGGYVSSCAGSYLSSTTYEWSLGVIDSAVIDRDHWARGSGDVACELTPAGKAIFGDKEGQFPIHYANGPLLGPATRPSSLTPYTVLCYFRGDMAKTAPGGVMPNTPAIISGEFGKGRVMCFSPHPEYTDGLGIFIPDALHWVTRTAKPTTMPGN